MHSNSILTLSNFDIVNHLMFIQLFINVLELYNHNELYVPHE